MDANYARSCLISQTMRQAELAWRTSWPGRPSPGIAQSIERRFPEARPRHRGARCWERTNAG